ncbi:MAG: hypothetical protein QMD36_02785 [Candidatus Aenigmarchaeota archaeon]|nr:hypothetical protein [Candidatus Aenigmarchaeota archaeon]
MVKRKKLKPWKTVVFWILGAVCALIASFIAGNITLEPWTAVKSSIALMVALFFYLIAGLFWISIAIAAKESD